MPAASWSDAEVGHRDRQPARTPRRCHQRQRQGRAITARSPSLAWYYNPPYLYVVLVVSATQSARFSGNHNIKVTFSLVRD